MRHLRFLIGAVVTMLVAMGLVNPALQPSALYERYRLVVSMRVVAVDIDTKLVTFAVVDVCKGTLAATDVRVALSGPVAVKAANDLLVEGNAVVAFVGNQRPGREGDVLFYLGSGRWMAGRLEKADDPARWIWDQDLGLGMFGTFNGAPDRLAEMMADARDGRYFFPATPYAGFKQVVTIGTVAGPARGVALYDLDGDGRLDVVACSEQGDRVWMQTAPLVFSERTKALGLDGSASPSVAIGDLNGDGIPDLLLGSRIYLGSGVGPLRTFVRADLLPAGASDHFKCATLVEIDGDGWPDVVISRRGKGLAVYLNSGAKGGKFADATTEVGLAAPECGSDGDGFFAAGDWDGDGRSDIFYVIRSGLLLVRGGDGRFAPVDHGLDPALDDGEGLGGTAAFAPLWRRDGRDLIFSTGTDVHLLVNVAGRTRERTAAANELTETSLKQLAMIAEDLDADGSVDVFVASREQLPCKLFTNRGYGSFTVPLKYKAAVMPESVQQFGTWGLAAGDATGDGANDLLMGGVDGRILLLVNGTLDDRPLVASDEATAMNQVLARTRIVSVTVSGRGTVGAEVVLSDAAGRVVCRRQVGGNTATGCRGPDTLNMAVREPGPMTLTVRYGDGVKKSWPVSLTIPERRTVMRAHRD